MERGSENPWKFNPAQVDEEHGIDDDDDDEDSSVGSTVTILEQTEPEILLAATVAVVTPGSPPRCPTHLFDLALEETPEDKQSKQRKAPDDCHVLIRWLELQKLVKEHFACAECGQGVVDFNRRTVGIATELDFYCKSCKTTATAEAIRSNYTKVDESKDFIRQRRINNYELNWRLVMATQLLGESQVGGAIIGLFLDLNRDAFRNSWTPMEEALGAQQIRIGQRIADANLKQETMGKVGTYCEDGKVRYPVSVLYDMGWQKAAKTYDSLSGQGLMIGDRTKRVVCYHNYSKSCRMCQLHKRRIEKNKTPNLPVPQHRCPKNHEGSSKGMEAKAGLECVSKVWTHREIKAFIDLICIDDDASTKAYLSHKFADLDAKNLARPIDTKGQPKRAKRDDKGRLVREHPPIQFLADLCHRVRTFGKYLYALKKVGKKTSEMNDVDCLRLKRNFAWWLFTGRKLTFLEFQQSAESPVLHHFNNHSKCGTWCKHRSKSEAELKQLKKYRCMENNKKLYLQCMEIVGRFSDEEHLRECHHRMHSQKNEAMNRSIMRYCPKEKTFCRSMALTSRINLAIAIDTDGHAKYYEELFEAMGFTTAELTFSGLRRMWRKKEHGRIYRGHRVVKKRRRINNRNRMVEGCLKMEEDAKDGRAYSSGIRLCDENEEGQQPRTKKAKKQHNNKQLTGGCKCGGQDHKRISSTKCPWKGLSKSEVASNYEERLKEMKKMKEMEPTATTPTVDLCQNPTEGNVQLTGKLVGAKEQFASTT